MQTSIIWQRDRLSRDELRTLIEQPAGPCVSLFLPIERAEPERHHSPTQLENMLRQAEQRLGGYGLDQLAAHDMLAPAYQLVEDQAFWAHQGQGLALFVTADLLRIHRLPLGFEQQVVVDRRPLITPLLPLLAGDSQFYLLALGLGGVRLFAGTLYGLCPVALEDLPASLKDALRYDDFAKQAQLHPGIPGHGGERGAIFHGQGARDGALAKQEVLRYFQLVERSVRHALRDARAPLLLAGVAYLLPIYRTANSYPQLIEDQIAVNPDDLGLDELHARAWALAAPLFERARVAAAERYQQLRATHPGLATGYLRAIIPAAYDGRVETLFVAAGQQRWGAFEPVSGELMLHDQAGPRDSELLNLAATESLLHGGTVYAVAPEQMPEAGPLAAILRY